MTDIEHAPGEGTTTSTPTLDHNCLVTDAMTMLTRSAQRCCLVTLEGNAIAFVDLDELATLRPDATVGSQVRRAVVQVPPGSGEDQTLATFTRAAWQWLLYRDPISTTTTR